MRRQDKRKNMEQANLMLEQSYLKNKGLLNENLFSKIKQAWQDWRTTRKEQKKKEFFDLVWRQLRDDIVGFTVKNPDFGFVDEERKLKIYFNYGSGEVVEEDPLTFEFNLDTYKENDERGPRRYFKYTMPKKWEDNISNFDASKGEVEEDVSKRQDPW